MNNWYAYLECRALSEETAKSLGEKLRECCKEFEFISYNKGGNKGDWYVHADGPYDAELRAKLFSVSETYPQAMFVLNCEDNDEMYSFWREEIHAGRIRFLCGEVQYTAPSSWLSLHYRTKEPINILSPHMPEGVTLPVGTQATVGNALGDGAVFVSFNGSSVFRMFDKDEFERCFEAITPATEHNKDMGEYERYQLQWMIDHGYSLRSLIEELRDRQYADPEDSGRISTPVTDLFDELAESVWLSKSEWLEKKNK